MTFCDRKFFKVRLAYEIVTSLAQGTFPGPEGGTGKTGNLQIGLARGPCVKWYPLGALSVLVPPDCMQDDTRWHCCAC